MAINIKQTRESKQVKTFVKPRIGFVAVCLTFVALTGVPVLAIGQTNSHAAAQTTTATTNGSSNAGTGGTDSASSNGSNSSSVGSSQTAAQQAAAKTRLAAAQLKACQNRQSAINNILARIADRGQKQLDLFSGIATKVEGFYTKGGKTLSNYDSLVAAVNTQKTTAQAAVDAIKSNSSGFSCDGNDPKGFVTAFQDSLKSEISALQAYRTAVKNLIVEVESVQGATSSSSAGSNSSSQTTSGGSQ